MRSPRSRFLFLGRGRAHPQVQRPVQRLGLLLSLLLCASLLWPLTAKLAKPAMPEVGVSEQIFVDQFGWRSEATKIALIANPNRGQNVSNQYQPGSTFEIRQEGNGQTVYQGQLQPWRRGELDESSGDRVWSADFSSLRQPGHYYLYDPENQRRSYGFEIQANPYGAVLTAAMKTFYYQRCGQAIAPEFGGNWSRPPCHIGRDQDALAARYSNGQQPRDVHGGWHDAGDFNKYLPFTAKTLWNLLDAYEQNPTAFGDRSHIPESGNGVPDLLDEIKWELDWMLRMQLEDGSVANRVASAGEAAAMPHQDSAPRYYTEPTTWGTAAFIVGTANAARLFEPFDSSFPGYGDRLLTAAERAWVFLEQHPQMLPRDGKDHGQKPTLSPASQADAEGRDGILRLWAAAELYRATGHEPYRTSFEAIAGLAPRAGSAQLPSPEAALSPDGFDPYKDLAFVTYARALGETKQPSAILPQLKASLRATLAGINNLDSQGVDPYRAYISDYHWGSNQSKANWGLLFLLAQELGLEDLPAQDYRSNAEEYLHYFHGRNPLGWVYLSNMGAKGAKAGAEKSVMKLYHGWFQPKGPYDGAESRYGPAPGFVTGGPNQHYSAKQVAPPYGEPPQKAFRDWNIDKEGLGLRSQAPWEITEPAIYYQAAYVDLLANFAREER